MLRKSSRPLTSKQTIVNDHSNHQWFPPEKPTKPSNFFFNSPTFFKNFFNYKINPNPIMNPTSILDKNPFSTVVNFLAFHNKKCTKKQQKNHCWEQFYNKQGIGIGLALIDENTTTTTTTTTTMKQQKRKLVVFGSQLRIKVENSSVFPCFSSELSPKEFGIKTPKNKIWPFGRKNSQTQVHPKEFCATNVNVSLTMSDIDEESEDYTCVISHGSNPKTTHIFGNCIVESCCGKIVGSPCFDSKRVGNVSVLSSSDSSQESFLSFCCHCKKKLGDGKDIYMYRGEKGFCSEECRSQEMLFDQVEN